MELKYCCGRPPRLIHKKDTGYSVVCMECGLGLKDNYFSVTSKLAEEDWVIKTSSYHSRPVGPAKVLLKELNDAHDVLRNFACILGVGGYNAPEVDAYVFSKKISDGIDMLTAPLMKWIEELQAENRKLKEPLGKGITYGKIFIDPEEIIATTEVDENRYSLQRNGMVQVVNIKTYAKYTTSIKSIGFGIQDVLIKASRERTT